MAEIIKFNVGGASFSTLKSTILSRDPNSMLATLLTTDVPVTKLENGEIFIDRDPKHFRVILNYLRDGIAILPDGEAALEEVLSEAEFYLLDGLKTLIVGTMISNLSLGTDENAVMKADENALRARFMEGAMNPPGEVEGLLDVFGAGVRETFVESAARLPNLTILDGHRSVEAGKPSICRSYEEFEEQFDHFTGGVFQGFDWTNFVVAGGSVLGALLPIPAVALATIGKTKATKARDMIRYYRGGNSDHWYGRVPGHEATSARSEESKMGFGASTKAVHGFEGSDVDLFLVGCTAEVAIQRISYLHDFLRAKGEILVVRTHRSITMALSWPNRSIQIILRLYASPLEVLIGFDLDCVAFAYDASHSRVLALPRARRALNLRANFADPSRQTFRTNTYEYRLWKYSKRGFAVVIPGLRRSMIDSTIYLRPYAELTGLARLLHLEARDYTRVLLGAETKKHSSSSGAYDQWLREAAMLTKGEKEDEATFLSFVESEIVSNLEDYNQKTLVAMRPQMRVSDMYKNLMGRLFKAASASRDANNPAPITYIAVLSLPREESKFTKIIMDARNFKLQAPNPEKSGELEDRPFVLAIPASIEFLGSLNQYIASLPETEDDWFRMAIKTSVRN